jgi:hypothetical protein
MAPGSLTYLTSKRRVAHSVLPLSPLLCSSRAMPLHSIISSLRARRRTPRTASSRPETDKLGWRLADVFSRTWDLGFTAFGGPPVHFQILHRRFVEGGGRLGSQWIDEQTVSTVPYLLHRKFYKKRSDSSSIRSCSQSVKLCPVRRLPRWCSASR